MPHTSHDIKYDTDGNLLSAESRNLKIMYFCLWHKICYDIMLMKNVEKFYGFGYGTHRVCR